MFILATILLYVLLYFFFPKGNPIQETLALPMYWFRTAMVSTRNLKVVKHSYGTHRRQYFLWLSPKKGIHKTKPIVIYYHGGGWRFGRPEQFKANAKIFTDLGLEVIMPTFRPCPRFNYRDIRSDLNATLQAIDKIGSAKQRPKQQFILAGMSAGGNLVAHLLYDQAALASIGWSQERFRGILLCAAPLDLSQMRDSFVLRHFSGKRNSPLFQAATIPSYLTSPQTTPVFCIHGTKDGLVAYHSTSQFIQQLRPLQAKKIQWHRIPNGTHLDAGSWVYKENEIRQKIVDWINMLL